MEEKWKDVIGYEGIYKISNTGKVYSCPRDVQKGTTIQHRKGRIMSLRENRDGYYIAKLNVDGKSKNVAIHRLVALHFVENKDPEVFNEVNHIDRNRKNNNADNLEWCTHKYNVSYSASFGSYSHFGEKNPNYRGTKLKKFYLENPERKSLLLRPGEKNGNSIKVECTFEDGSRMVFSYIGECALFVWKRFQNLKQKSIYEGIRKAVSCNGTYKGMSFKKI